MKKLLTFLILAFVLQSCENKAKNEKKDNTSTNKTWEVKQDNFSITIEIIDSIQFYTQKKAIKQPIKPLKKITDFATAKKMLKGIVEFRENEHYASLRRILFQNGNSYNSPHDEESFVAYYPTEEIILFEGGHATDISFNLKTENKPKKLEILITS